MSRIPQPSSPRTPSKPTHSPTSLLSPGTPRTRTQSTVTSSSRPTTTPLRTQRSLKTLKPTSKSPAPPKSPVPRRAMPAKAESPEPSRPQLSIREQIALRRAEAKKAQTGPAEGNDGLDFVGFEEALPGNTEDEVGRWSVKESIERARSSGTLNLISRALPCLPSALFEIHLGIKSEPLKSVPQEPPISTSTTDEISAGRRRGGQSNAPSWYEAQDLQVLKAWSNEIVEIQPEISMFGSLKTVDLHNNKLVSLPDSFADLTALVILDLSHNALTSLPVNLFVLPNLTTLNLSHNSLTSLPFRAPLDTQGSNTLSRTRDARGDWFSQSITRATAPLPRLTMLNASHNHLAALSIQCAGLPSQINKLDLSANPLGPSTELFLALARLERLRELLLERAEIGDDSFPADILSSLSPSATFPVLKVLDLGETHVTRVLRVVIGKKVIREAWEIEAERRAKTKAARYGGAGVEEGLNIGGRASRNGTQKQEVVQEAWEIEAEQGLLTEGAKRRARAAAAAARTSSPPASSASSPTPTSPRKNQVVQKEPWEIEAEQGLLTEGAKRRARAQAAAAAAASTNESSRAQAASPALSEARSSPSPSPNTAHARSISLAVSSWGDPRRGGASSGGSDLALAIPTAALPLAAIAAQPLAQTLRVLNLVNRRKDPSFSLSADDGPFLPCLEELSLQGCSLPDSVPVSHVANGDEYSSLRRNEPLLSLLAKLFPSMRTLDLSYNTLSSAALTKDALTHLILAAPSEEIGNPRKGLRHLRLRGNRITELDGFQGLAEMFKGNRDVPQWRLEELDLRDNEIGKIPPELGLLSLDVFLVDGNVFRVPQRRVWEREGTKGLLSWLRGRIE
ncbi:uncharacterized protein B0H18DRAFT_1086012 [Fomitopsis serialis]|uniref:uncharacterized protein n=1 Tax=Fomitopsis serialis TaxID=139415 RepID=UPI002008B8CC|nr:uncharacterized protein B0H18DRAFT_1086012 [Neoantrodia serialis]KAH9921865.1 hypothetical protein B0H18DRAFT_1086012 [Neoantrodia serialis]